MRRTLSLARVLSRNVVRGERRAVIQFPLGAREMSTVRFSSRLFSQEAHASDSGEQGPIKLYNKLWATEESHPFLQSLRVSPHTLSAKELREEADALATGLAELGAEPGAVILVCVEGGGTHCVVQLAASKMGITLAFVDPSVDEGVFVESIRTVQPWGIIIAPGKANHRAHMLQRIFPDTLSAGWTRNIEQSKDFPSVSSIICTGTEVFSGMSRFEDILVHGRRGAYYVDGVYENPGAFLLEVSQDGKEATETTEEEAIDLAAKVASALQLKQGDVVLALPPFLTPTTFVASTLAPIASGVTVILPRSGDKAALAEALDGPIPTVIVGNEQAHAALDEIVDSKLGAVLKGARRINTSNLRIGQ